MLCCHLGTISPYPSPLITMPTPPSAQFSLSIIISRSLPLNGPDLPHLTVWVDLVPFVCAVKDHSIFYLSKYSKTQNCSKYFACLSYQLENLLKSGIIIITVHILYDSHSNIVSGTEQRCIIHLQ